MLLLAKELKKGRKYYWHPEYQFLGWKDGKDEPRGLMITHIAPMDKGYYVGYRCFDKFCRTCKSKHISHSLGGHHILIDEAGFAFKGKIIFKEIMKKKQVTSVVLELPNPAFIKMEK